MTSSDNSNDFTVIPAQPGTTLVIMSLDKDNDDGEGPDTSYYPVVGWQVSPTKRPLAIVYGRKNIERSTVAENPYKISFDDGPWESGLEYEMEALRTPDGAFHHQGTVFTEAEFRSYTRKLLERHLGRNLKRSA